MSGYRITKIVCPSCKGSGHSQLFDVQCLWCFGTKSHAYHCTVALVIGQA